MTATVKEQAQEIVNKFLGEIGVGEDELRAEIASLDKKIKKQRAHIDKLTAELATKQAERNDLVRERIELLKKELPQERAKSDE